MPEKDQLWDDCSTCGEENCVMWGDNGDGLEMLCVKCDHVYGTAQLGVLDESLGEDAQKRVEQIFNAVWRED